MMLCRHFVNNKKKIVCIYRLTYLHEMRRSLHELPRMRNNDKTVWWHKPYGHLRLGEEVGEAPKDPGGAVGMVAEVGDRLTSTTTTCTTTMMDTTVDTATAMNDLMKRNLVSLNLLCQHFQVHMIPKITSLGSSR